MLDDQPELADRVILDALRRELIGVEQIERLQTRYRDEPGFDPLALLVDEGWVAPAQLAPLLAQARGAPAATEQGPRPIEEAEPLALPERLGRFRLLERIGGGGFGEIHRARQEGVEREVAVKILPPALARQPGVIERFRREIRAAGSLHHPNLVGLIDVGEEHGLHYYAMEYLGGTTLADLIEQRGALRAGVAALIALGVARGLAAAHRAGIVHRDVKPDNILLASSGEEQRPVLIDFGLVQLDAASRLTASRQVLGTPLYMAPEQCAAEGAAVGPPADVYALGVVLFEMLTGAPPFEGSPLPRVLWLKSTEAARWPRRQRPVVPHALRAICLRALSVDPMARYPDAGRMALDLERFLEGRPTEARLPGPAQRLRRLLLHGRRPPALLAALVLLLAALASWLDRTAPDATRRAAEQRGRLLERAASAEHRLEQAGRLLEHAPPEALLLLDRLAGELEPLEQAAARAGLTDGGRRWRRLLRLQAEAVVRCGRAERYSSALAVLRTARERDPTAALLAAQIALERTGLARLALPPHGAPPAREAGIFPAPQTPPWTGERRAGAQAALADLARAAPRHPAATLEQARLLLFLGRTAEAKSALEAAPLAEWRASRPALWVRAQQAQMLEAYGSGRWDAVLERHAQVRRRQAADPELDAALFAPADHTLALLLWDRFLEQEERPLLDRLQRVLDGLLRDERAAARFPDQLWRLGLVRLLRGGPPASCSALLERAVRAHGHRPRRDPRLSRHAALRDPRVQRWLGD